MPWIEYLLILNILSVHLQRGLMGYNRRYLGTVYSQTI